MNYCIYFILFFFLICQNSFGVCELRSHRGNLLNHPEHTIESYIDTLKAGATLIELDVQLSSDNVPVVIHDTTVDRTTDGTGTVVSKTLAQLKALDAGVDFGGGYAGRRIPTLEEALIAIKPYRAYVMIETKGNGFMPYVSLAIQRSDFPIDRLHFLAGLFSDTAVTFRTHFPSAIHWLIVSGTPSGAGVTNIRNFRTISGYSGLSFWPETMVEADYVVMREADVLFGEYEAGGTGIYNKAILGCNMFLTDNPVVSQSEWGTELWSNFVSQYSLGGSGQNDDLDGDGFTNLQELVFGMDPTIDDIPSYPYGVSIKYTGSGGNRVADITCRTPQPILEGYWFKVQVSSNGTSWSDASASIVTESAALWPKDRAWRIRVNLNNSSNIVRVVPVLYSTAIRSQ